ncbi:regulation of response to stimulus [Branchiostoma belcheri]|nr:regulation of response to stimulus [Branchiostoma belcheri]
MKWTGCWVVVICFVFGIASSTLDHPPNLQAQECLFRAWDACMIKWQWIALRGVYVGKLSSQTLEIFNPPSLVILALIDAGIRKRTLRGPTVITVGGRRRILSEQDKMDWSLTVDKTNFPWRKQEVRFLLHNLQFCLTYHGVKIKILTPWTYSTKANAFDLRWGFVGTVKSDKAEPDCESTLFGPLKIRAPFVIAALETQEKGNETTSYDMCPAAWGRQGGISVALEGGATLQLVGLPGEPKLLKNNGSTALVCNAEQTLVSKKSKLGATTGHINRVSTGMMNISCFVFHRNGTMLEPNIFKDVQGEVDSKCPAKDTLNVEFTHTATPPYYQIAGSATENVTMLANLANEDVENLTMLANLVENSPNRTLLPPVQPNTTILLTQERTDSRYLMPIVVSFSSTLLACLMLVSVRRASVYYCKRKNARNVAQNILNTGVGNRFHVHHSTISATGLIRNPMYYRSGQNSELNNVDEKVPHPTNRSHLDQLATCVVNPKYRGSDLVLARPPHANGGDETVSVHTYSEIKDEEVYDPCLTHNYSDIKDEDSCVTHNYSDIKDEDVGDEENEENIQVVNKENQNGRCSERDDVVRFDCQTEDPNDDVVTFYAAAAEVMLPPATLEGDARQHYNTTQGNTQSSHVLYSAAELE